MILQQQLDRIALLYLFRIILSHKTKKETLGTSVFICIPRYMLYGESSLLVFWSSSSNRISLTSSFIAMMKSYKCDDHSSWSSFVNSAHGCSMLLHPSFEERKDLSSPATTIFFPFLLSASDLQEDRSVCRLTYWVRRRGSKRRTTPNTYVARCIVSIKEILDAVRYGEPLV